MALVAPAPSIVRLSGELTGRDVGDPFTDELTAWLSSTPRFRAFATTYNQKIRKKVHHAVDAEALRDVRAELLTARRLLADKRFAVAYEAYGSGRSGPDLTVTYRTTTAFNVEVTRLRKPPDPAPLGSTILVKLRQLPPSVPNVILVASDTPASVEDVAGAVGALRARADPRETRSSSGADWRAGAASMSASCGSAPSSPRATTGPTETGPSSGSIGRHGSPFHSVWDGRAWSACRTRPATRSRRTLDVADTVM